MCRYAVILQVCKAMVVFPMTLIVLLEAFATDDANGEKHGPNGAVYL